MDSKTSLSVLYEIVKNDSIFILQEYPIDFNAPAVTSHAGVYSNEFIFTFLCSPFAILVSADIGSP